MGDDRLEIINIFGLNPNLIPLDGGLDFEFLIFDDLHDLFGDLLVERVVDGVDHSHAPACSALFATLFEAFDGELSLDEFAMEHVFDCIDFVVAAGVQSERLLFFIEGELFEFILFEVKAGGDFALGLIKSVFKLLYVEFGGDVKDVFFGGHARLLESGFLCQKLDFIIKHFRIDVVESPLSPFLSSS